MISRLLALIAMPIMAYFLAKSVSQRFSLTPRQNRILFVIIAALLLVGILVVLGRLPIQFVLAPLSALAVFLMRMLPIFLRMLPMWQMFKSRSAAAKPREKGQASTIRTEYLAMELAYPQAMRRGLLSIASFVVGVRWLSSDTAISFPPASIVHEGTRITDLTGFLTGCAFFLSAWAAYGVYRTILATRVEREVKDIL